ncbi:hypothetical protein ACH4M4_36025 [Streptomyces sp. NPDC017254]|uniref:hypothetical protein n=1 Tax=unclassified Streptomyces TaxID=2593676 RepID=UPI003798C368
MDQLHPPSVVTARTTLASPDRRLIAVGTTRRHDGRTITVRATEAGVTGTITARGGAR